ncbi:MAG: FAD-dependent monooxygenase [Verrucomicrobiota bacterium]|jgi:2-polyprenyl-6-methoxyphenol hydroxylase-like FAD-dependent oxidoreductase
MAAGKSITIVGGGLAGLTLGLGLRRRGVPVTICEAGHYPRHRVCGEFICGQGLAVLERQGLLARCQEAGAIQARTAMFVCGRHRSPVRPLPAPALCLSRHTLDALLAKSFAEGGGELRLNDRRPLAERREGLVHACGRRAQPVEHWPRWIGVKAHVFSHCRVPLEADLEMHVSPHGYVGLNRINAGEINVCGLFRIRENSARPESKLDWLRGGNGSLLRDRLRSAEFAADSFCAVAGLRLKPRRAEPAECCVGDALTMTPPVTGNGMSMAFESAEMAIDPLAAYSEGRLAWPDARQQIAQRCDAAFACRLFWARLLQWMMMSPVLQVGFGPVLLGSGRLWQCLFKQTR